jgi:hypothetical protein
MGPAEACKMLNAYGRPRVSGDGPFLVSQFTTIAPAAPRERGKWRKSLARGMQLGSMLLRPQNLTARHR